MNSQTKSQMESIIVLECLRIANEAGCSTREQYVVIVEALFKSKGITHDPNFIIDLIMHYD